MLACEARVMSLWEQMSQAQTALFCDEQLDHALDHGLEDPRLPAVRETSVKPR